MASALESADAFETEGALETEGAKVLLQARITRCGKDSLLRYSCALNVALLLVGSVAVLVLSQAAGWSDADASPISNSPVRVQPSPPFP